MHKVGDDDDMLDDGGGAVLSPLKPPLQMEVMAMGLLMQQC